MLIYAINIKVHSVCPQEGYSATYVDGRYNESWATLHLALFRGKPEHFAAIRQRLSSSTEDEDYPFADSSPELTARIRDELDEMAKTRCSSLFQRYKHMASPKETTARVYCEVTQTICSEAATLVVELQQPAVQLQPPAATWIGVQQQPPGVDLQPPAVQQHLPPWLGLHQPPEIEL